MRSIVIAPARTGRDRRRRTVVMIAAQTNKGICSRCISLFRILTIVAIKLIDPKIEEAPAR